MTMNISWSSFWYSFKKYSEFNRKEINAIILSAAIIGFIIAFRGTVDQPDRTLFDFGFALRNLIDSILIVSLAIIVKQICQRAAAVHSGFKAVYRIWWYGLGLGIILGFATMGRFWFLAPGGIMVYHLAGHRLGSFRYGLNYWPLGIIGLVGPVSLILLAIFFKIMMNVFPANALIAKAFVFNLVFAGFSALPIPPLDGSHMFFASRMFYIFALGTIIGLCVALYFMSIGWALLIGLLIGVLVWQIYLWTFETPGK